MAETQARVILLLVFIKEDRATSQGMQVASGAEKDTRFSLDASGGMQT